MRRACACALVNTVLYLPVLCTVLYFSISAYQLLDENHIAVSPTRRTNTADGRTASCTSYY